MSMIRSPVVYTGETLHGRLPALGRAFWYKLRDSSEQRGMVELPALTKTVTGSESGSAYTDATLYQFPTDNGNTNTVEWVATEDEDTLYVDSVCTLVGMEAGEQIIVALDIAYVEQATSDGALWALGSFSSAGHIGFGFTSAEAPQLHYRPRTTSGGSNSTQALTYASGDTFAAFKAQGRFTVVTSIHVLSSTTIEVEMRIGNGTLEGLYTYTTPIDVLGAGINNPGFSGQTIANFRGFAIGCIANSDTGSTRPFGRGATNVARIDQVIGWRGTYDAGLTAAVLEDMAVTNRLDFPPALCSAA